MIREQAGESPIDAAARRLEQAVATLEKALSARAQAPGAVDPDSRQLAADLDRARERERELEAAGAQASAALGRAIAEIRAALGDQTEEA